MKKLIYYFIIPFIILSVSAIIYCNSCIESVTRDKVYNNSDDIPFNRVGLLLGTSRYMANGSRNPFYTNRIQAAVELIRKGRINYLVISGDNGRQEYNEPESMKRDLVNAGIDSTILFLDYAGFRTFDSVIRMHEIFSQDSITVISQRFHNERAIYIAQRQGMYAVGFNAADVSQRAGFQTQLREKLARVKVFVDYLIQAKPKFLGEKVLIPS